MRVYDALTSLLRSALWGVAPDIGIFTDFSDADWDALFSMAVDQAVAGVAYDAVAQISAPGITNQLWRQTAEMIVERNRLVSAVQDKQAQTWRKYGLAPYVVKGSMCAALYPVPEHRQSGDIDWCFCEEGEWAKGLEVVRKNGLEVKFDSDGDFSYELSGVVVEHHRKGLVRRTGAGMVFCLVDHVFHHFSTSGIGLRQLCDLALALEKMPYDAAELEGHLKKAGLSRFFLLVKSYLAADLGIAQSGAGAVPEEDVDAFRCMVVKDGNFGLGKQKRFGGVRHRAHLCMKYAPKAYFKRWSGLFFGRMRRSWIVK